MEQGLQSSCQRLGALARSRMMESNQNGDKTIKSDVLKLIGKIVNENFKVMNPVDFFEIR